MKIAIIGSGISGLTSAYLLAPHHEVTVYEKDSRLGGHTHTHILNINGQKVIADTGFMVFNPDRYPLFLQLLDDLDIESRDTNMSFSVHIPGTVSYRGNFPNGLFADRMNIFRPRYLKFLRQVIRFRTVAKQELDNNPKSEERLADFLNRSGFSDDFSQWFLYPMLAAIWSVEETDEVDNFPALATLRFLDNHKLLDQRHPTWQTIGGGGQQYIDAIQERVESHSGTFILNSDIEQIKRSKDTITIKSNNSTETYDKLIMATHANTTAELLDVSKEEQKALAKFSYTKNHTVLHSDNSFVSPNPRVLAAWNYLKENAHAKKASFTYSLNILQHVDDSIPLYVTLNPAQKIDATKVHAEMDYEHPLYSTDSIVGQELIEKLQGQNNTYFAGAHLGFGFHEDGVASAVNVAQKLEVPLQWQIPA